MTEKKELTIRKFMLKKFPPKKYFDCPIPKEYWDLFDEYAQQQLKANWLLLENRIKELRSK